MNANETAIEAKAWNCDQWPAWLHKIVDQTNEVADRLDMSAEQAHAYAAFAALAEAAAVPPDVAGVEPVAWQWRGLEQDEAPTQWLFETEDVINAWKGAVARSPQKYSIERRPLYSADALASLAARAEALAQLNARLEDHLYEARQSAEAEATRLRGELARVRAETVGWQPMDTAPRDGKHVLLCVPSGPFFWTVEGTYHNGKWLAAFCDEPVVPVYWAPQVKGFVLPTSTAAIRALEPRHE